MLFFAATRESTINLNTLSYVKQVAGGNLLNDAGSSQPVFCDNLQGQDGWEVGGGFKREGSSVYLLLVHDDVWQRPIQYCKAIILQLKISK